MKGPRKFCPLQSRAGNVFAGPANRGQQHAIGPWPSPIGFSTTPLNFSGDQDHMHAIEWCNPRIGKHLRDIRNMQRRDSITAIPGRT